VAKHYGDPYHEQRLLEGSGTAVAGTWARDAIRIANGRLESRDKAAPGEALVLVHLDGSDNVLPTAGDQIYSRNVRVGHITSVADHYELGPIALASVNEEYARPGADVQIRTEPYAGDQVDIPGRVDSILPGGI
jgi:hypothetical protein